MKGIRMSVLSLCVCFGCSCALITSKNQEDARGCGHSFDPPHLFLTRRHWLCHQKDSQPLASNQSHCPKRRQVWNEDPEHLQELWGQLHSRWGVWGEHQGPGQPESQGGRSFPVLQTWSKALSVMRDAPVPCVTVWWCHRLWLHGMETSCSVSKRGRRKIVAGHNGLRETSCTWYIISF